MMTPKGKKREEFVQEYLYIEEYPYYPELEKSSDEGKLKEEDEKRGVIIIDLISYEKE